MSSKKITFKREIDIAGNQITNNLSDISKMTDISYDIIALTSPSNYNDLQMLSPTESIMQSLKNLIKLPIGGNALFPTRGEKVSEMLFNPALSKQEAEALITSYLSMNEQRIIIHSVTGSKQINDFNEQIVTLNVSYSFKNSNEIYNAIVELSSEETVDVNEQNETEQEFEINDED